MFSTLTTQERILYFLIGCIGIRTIIAVSPLYTPSEWLPLLGLFTLSFGVSFLYLYFVNGRLNAPEGGGVTWWASYRLLHGLLYVAASIYLFKKQRIAWLPLTMDVLLGLGVFLVEHSLITLP